MPKLSVPITKPGWNREQQLVNEYLARALEEFDTNRLSVRLIRRLSLEVPGCFLTAAMQVLLTGRESNALRHVTAVLLRQEGALQVLTDPQLCSRENAVTLFKRFQQIEPSFDVHLARKLPDRRGSNWAEALSAAHSTRALDILDQTSYGRRLLPVVSHLVDNDDNRVSAKATLFVGRRIQNPSWTERQLAQTDQRVRANAIEALWGVDSPAATNILEDCKRDSSHRVMGNALFGLHLLGRPEVDRRVIDMSNAGKFEMRLTAAWLLGRMDGTECIDCLTRLVKDEHPQVRSRALWSLLEIRRTRAKSPEAILARAAVKSPEAKEQTVESAAAAVRDVNLEGYIKVRLDGTRFHVR